MRIGKALNGMVRAWRRNGSGNGASGPAHVALSAQETEDSRMMRRCIELSRIGTAQGELPFACIIVRDGEILAEATNRVSRDLDVTRHAEIIALQQAQQALGRRRLKDCTLYSSVEPCAMCAFPIRETGIGRVAFAITSPAMGGLSKWNVLADHDISERMPQYFRRPPEVIAGLLAAEAEQAWREWNPLIWAVIKRRGCLGEKAIRADLPLP